jgi:hypothetical protein
MNIVQCAVSRNYMEAFIAFLTIAPKSNKNMCNV